MWKRENRRKTGTGVETGTETRIEKGKGGRRRAAALVSATSGNKQQEYKTRQYHHSARDIIYTLYSVNMEWRLKVASSFGRKTWRQPDDVVPRGEQGHQRREAENNGDGNRDGGGDGNEDEDRNRHEGGDRGGNGSGNGDESR